MPLNETGQQQAEALARRLADEEIHAIYASDLRRAWETAAIIGVACGQPVHPEPRLREIDFGAWKGLMYDEIKAQLLGTTNQAGVETEVVDLAGNALGELTGPGDEAITKACTESAEGWVRSKQV